MTGMRNAKQVAAVYEALNKQGKADDPYILKYERGGRLLIFFGARHSNDPEDAQWIDLEKHWKAFIGHTNSRKIVLYEQGPLNLEHLSKIEALQQESESGLVVWLAALADIPTE